MVAVDGQMPLGVAASLIAWQLESWFAPASKVVIMRQIAVFSASGTLRSEVRRMSNPLSADVIFAVGMAEEAHLSPMLACFTGLR